MSSQYSVVLPYSPPSGADYSENVGLIVYLSDAGEVTVQTDPSVATGKAPIGVIVGAQDGANGTVSVCVAGKCKVKAGAPFTIGTTTPFFMAGGDSRADPATDGNWACGYLLGLADAADGQFYDCVVAPQNYEIS